MICSCCQKKVDKDDKVICSSCNIKPLNMVDMRNAICKKLEIPHQQNYSGTFTKDQMTRLFQFIMKDEKDGSA